MKLPVLFILTGLLLAIGAAVYAQSQPPTGNIPLRGWLGRPTYAGGSWPVDVNGSDPGKRSGAREQALRPGDGASPPAKNDRQAQ